MDQPAGGWHERARREEKIEKKRSRPADPQFYTGCAWMISRAWDVPDEDKERRRDTWHTRTQDVQGEKERRHLSSLLGEEVDWRSRRKRTIQANQRRSEKKRRLKERREGGTGILEQGARHCVRLPTATVERRTLSVRAAGGQLVRSNKLRSLSFAAERSPSANIGSKQNYKLCPTPLAPRVPSEHRRYAAPVAALDPACTTSRTGPPGPSVSLDPALFSRLRNVPEENDTRILFLKRLILDFVARRMYGL